MTEVVDDKSADGFVWAFRQGESEILFNFFDMWAPLGTGSELSFNMSNNNEGRGWLENSPGIEFIVFQQVPMIEEGFHNQNVSQEIISAYLSNEMLNNIDELILGCTHYPLIKEEIKQYYKNAATNDIT